MMGIEGDYMASRRHLAMKQLDHLLSGGIEYGQRYMAFLLHFERDGRHGIEGVGIILIKVEFIWPARRDVLVLYKSCGFLNG